MEPSAIASLENKRLKIVFMGSPEFAVPSLDALFQAGYEIVAIITAPDKPSGRGMQMTESAVKKYALKNRLSVMQPVNLKNQEFIQRLESLQADLYVVVAFRMLPEQVWKIPPKGTINLHASLLPDYRGAAPINWVLINGEQQTGVTTFRIQKEIDTGSIYLQKKIPIREDETAGELHDQIKMIGANLLLETVRGIENGHLVSRAQPDQGVNASGNFFIPLKTAPKIFSETCKIEWNKPVHSIYNLVRGLSPIPAAFTQLDGKVFKIYHSKVEASSPDLPAGQYKTDGKSFLKFACPDGWLHCLEIQMEGKKKMLIGDFLRGYRFPAG
ncbi:MAG: methionyl-tRNA formyltransferase [Chitinophagales bacterium]